MGYGMIERREYLDRLIAWRDKEIIKVVTGIRRCGKSKLLELYRNYLISRNVDESQIISIDLDDLDNARLCDKPKLHE
jgi:predicted AAA+ superfamily ATPase